MQFIYRNILTMSKHIAVIQGHPDPNPSHFGYALADAYIQGAEEAGFEVKRIKVASLDFPVLRTKDDFDRGKPIECIENVQQIITWADHLVIFYPLWLGTMPAYLQAFFEQVFRPGFAFEHPQEGSNIWKKHLTGKTAHIVVTMGMPAFVYRWFYSAHGLKSFKRNILAFCGIKTAKESLIGMVEDKDGKAREQWLIKLRAAGRKGE